VHLSIAPLDAIAIIAAGGTSQSTTIEAGGRMIVNADGRAATGLIQSGGSESVYGRDVNSTTNGAFSVMNGGFASGLTVGQGGKASIGYGARIATSLIGFHGTMLDAGRAVIMTVGPGGKFTITSGGFAANAQVQTGAAVDLQAGGRSIGAQIGTGGSSTVEGRAIDHVVGGSQTVEAGGFATRTLIQTAGAETVQTGARTANDIIAGSVNDFGRVLDAHVVGTLTVGAGGFVASTSVEAGGSILVQNGGKGVDLTIAGGLLDVQAGGSLVDAVAFTRGTLQLDSTIAVAAPISGFNGDDVIDFRSVVFNSQSASVGYSAGTLSISDGVHSQALTLLGAFTATSFTTLSDGAGGTYLELATPNALGAPRLPGALNTA
jgi:autotransporter passenger strand-loop-strand repeat protein